MKKKGEEEEYKEDEPPLLWAVWIRQCLRLAFDGTTSRVLYDSRTFLRYCIDKTLSYVFLIGLLFNTSATINNNNKVVHINKTLLLTNKKFTTATAVCNTQSCIIFFLGFFSTHPHRRL
jgi:hypothetical protein